MSTPEQRPRTEDATSYYDQQVKWVSENLEELELPELQPLFTCYLTIKEYHKLLYDPTVNLADDIVDTFIKDIMLVDFGHVIAGLLKYRGDDADIVLSAQTIIDAAQTALYEAYNSFVKTSEFQKRNAKVKALKACRIQLNEAYLLLEYLDRKIEKYYKHR